MNNPKVKIPLPPALDEVAKGLRMMGRGKDADELVATMNQAAEQAVPEAKALIVNAVKTMSVEDAKKILTGGDDSVTQFFRAKTAAPLAVKFLPIVKQATDRVGLAQKYDQFAGQGAKLGLIKGDAANIEQYVTDKALDGLYLMIGEEERTIRQSGRQAARLSQRYLAHCADSYLRCHTRPPVPAIDTRAWRPPSAAIMRARDFRQWN